MKSLLLTLLALWSFDAAFAAEKMLVKENTPASLRQLIDNCHKANQNVSIDLFLCPIVRTYRYTGDAKNLNQANKVNKILEQNADLFFSLRKVDTEEAAGIISTRLWQQLGFLREHETNREQKQASRQIETFINQLQNWVGGWQQLVFADDDTYWAPSVNSSAVVLINPESRLLIVIEHGDTDG